MTRRLRTVLLPILLLLAVTEARAQWQTLDFDLSKNDRQAYTSNIPAAAFTPEGLRLALKPGAEYSLTGRHFFSDEFDFDLQIEVLQRSEKGALSINLVLSNDERRRKVVGTYRNVSTRPGSDACQLRYFKDGKATGFLWDGRWQDFSSSVGYGERFIEWLRIHKALTKVWFVQKCKGDPYAWASSCEYPKPSYFGEDCESFRPEFVVRADAEATATLLIKAVRVSGSAVLPRDPRRRTFLFDFGPVDQELEDEFCPVNEFSTYTPAKGYGWVIPEPEKIWYERRDGVPQLDDAAIAARGLPPINKDTEGWYQSFVRTYVLAAGERQEAVLFHLARLRLHRVLPEVSRPEDAVGPRLRGHGPPLPLRPGPAAPEGHRGAAGLDLHRRRPLGRVPRQLAQRPLQLDPRRGLFQLALRRRLAVQRRGPGKGPQAGLGAALAAAQPVPHPRRATSPTAACGSASSATSASRWTPTANHNVGIGWMINYLLVLPAEDPELMGQWEWKIIKRRGEIIRRVTFVKGEPAATRNEGNFISLGGKPFYFHKVMNNYHPGASEHYPYYCLADVLSSQHGINNSAQFFRHDWEKLSYSDDYPWYSIDKLNMAYTWGYLTTLHHDGILSFVPHAASGEGSPTVDSRGRSNPYNIQPPLNSALGKEIQKEAYTMMSNHLRLHPAVGGHFIYEELWHPDELGYDDQSLLQYRDWLRRRYGTIEKLNEDWGRGYKSFDEIVQPETWKKEWFEYAPEFVNFRKFRGWAQRQMVRSACDTIRRLEPEHFSWGAKGDFGTQSWYTGEFVDMFGWYTPYVAASAARFFGQAAICGGYQLNCEHAYLDGRRQADHKPGPRQYLGRDEAEQVYGKLISAVFKGAKGFFSEWYEDGMCHAFHRTTLIREGSAKYQIKHWTGQLAFYEPPALEGPPVTMDRNALRASAANQLLLRLAPLWLPARPPQPKVLFPTTEASFYLNFFGERPYADFETVGHAAAAVDHHPGRLHVPGGRRRPVSVSIARAWATRPRPYRGATPSGSRQFVRKGGKLIMVNGGGFSDDARPRRYWKKPGDVYPLEEFAELGGYALRLRRPVPPAAGEDRGALRPLRRGPGNRRRHAAGPLRRPLQLRAQARLPRLPQGPGAEDRQGSGAGHPQRPGQRRRGEFSAQGGRRRAGPAAGPMVPPLAGPLADRRPREPRRRRRRLGPLCRIPRRRRLHPGRRLQPLRPRPAAGAAEAGHVCRPASTP